MAAYGRLDILVNNAGMLKMSPMTDMDVEKDWDAVFRLNLRSYFVATQHVARHSPCGSSSICFFRGFRGKGGFCRL
ncbi:MAG: SDR family NAD(P)-dependent oxidoreductase [Oscillospiraceae bacterium]|jgi:NAD(P)-dependent dehydrogenase (short-subunit alcohol dehydrogenase family)